MEQQFEGVRGADTLDIASVREDFPFFAAQDTAYLDNSAILDTRLDVLVKEVLGAGDALDHVVGIEDGEVGQLQRCHADGALNGHFDLGISLGHSHIRIMDQGKMVFLAHIHQTNVGRVPNTESRGILHGHLFHHFGCCFVLLVTLSRASTQQCQNCTNSKKFLHLDCYCFYATKVLLFQGTKDCKN